MKNKLSLYFYTKLLQPHNLRTFDKKSAIPCNDIFAFLFILSNIKKKRMLSPIVPAWKCKFKRKWYKK